MLFYIPLSYKLNKNEIDLNNNDFIIDDKNKTIQFNQLILHLNRKDFIYKITSVLKLEILLDILNINDNYLILKKIYYFLIIKYLLSFSFHIYNKSIFSNKCFYQNEDYYTDKIIRTREYCISSYYSSFIVIKTCSLNTNICLIITNKSFDKILFSIIDDNCDLECLYKIIPKVYNNSRFEDIKITIIGGSIENIIILINIYIILKKLRLSKYIHNTYIIKNKYLNKGIKYNSYNNHICFINNNIKEYDNSNHKIFQSSLHYKN